LAIFLNKQTLTTMITFDQNKISQFLLARGPAKRQVSKNDV